MAAMSTVAQTLEGHSVSKTPTTLLTLPAELRNQIYGYVFAEPYAAYIFDRTVTSTVTTRKRGALKDSRSYPFRLAILATCRQIHQEAALLPWILNIPCFNSFNIFIDTVFGLLPAQRPAITSIAFSIDTSDDADDIMDYVQRLKAVGCRNLKRLLPKVREVEFDVMHFSCRVHDAVNMLFTGCREMGKISRSCASRGGGRAAD